MNKKINAESSSKSGVILCPKKYIPNGVELATPSQTQLLRITDVSNLTTLGKSTINLWEARGHFPKSLSLSPTIKVWTLESIRNWIESQGDENE